VLRCCPQPTHGHDPCHACSCNPNTGLYPTADGGLYLKSLRYIAKGEVSHKLEVVKASQTCLRLEHGVASCHQLHSASSDDRYTSGFAQYMTLENGCLGSDLNCDA
jgi:hypothetical protein